MKHQPKTIMNKVFILISSIIICLCSNSNAQVLVNFNCEEDVEKIDNTLKEKTPFILKRDTTDKEIGYIENTLYFLKEDSVLKCFHYGDATECLDVVYKVKSKNTSVYVILFYEMLVGYNYCIIIREDLMEVFLTDIFNLNEDDLYELDYKSIDFINNIINAIMYDNAKNTKQIHFKKYSW